MITLADFSDWMSENTTLGESSIYKYTRAIVTISREMMEKGVILQDLFAMSTIQLDVFVPLILQDLDFVKKNEKGNNMYSNALKQYRMFRRVELCENVQTSDIINVIEGYSSLQETERSALVKARVGQGYFRNELLKKYDGRCIITGIQEKRLLIASHIKPWAVCDNRDRLSVENGLLLSPTFDKLFDCGLISFTNEGKLLISTILSEQDINRLHISAMDVYDIKASANLKRNLEYHRDVIFTTHKKKKVILN